MAKKETERDSDILRKLSRARFGGTDDSDILKLKSDMMHFARYVIARGEAYRNYESVRKWFVNGFGMTVTVGNYRFAKEYAKHSRDEVRKLDLDDDELSKRATIFERVISRCNFKVKKKEKVDKNRPIQFGNIRANIMTIDQSQVHHSNNDDFLENAIGFYETFRQPTIEKTNIITRELIEIFTHRSTLTINWYYRFDDGNVLPFTGHYIMSGDAAYYFLYNEKYKGRMRVLITPDMFWKQRRASDTSGVLVTQMPYVEDRSLFGLVSRKVCIRRLDAPTLTENQISQLVRRIDVKEIENSEYAEDIYKKLFRVGATGLEV